MDKNQENFLKELLNDFKIEASEHYQAIIDGLLVLEKENDATIQKACIEKVFREIHSLKGASRAVNLLDIEKLCMNLENIFNSLKKGEVKLSGQLLDVFYKANDLLNLLLKDVNQDKKIQEIIIYLKLSESWNLCIIMRLMRKILQNLRKLKLIIV